MENIEMLKAKISQTKSDLEKKSYKYISKNSDTTIDLCYSCYLNKILFRGEIIEKELLEELNIAMREVKKKMEEEYFTVLNTYGIKF